MTDASVTIDYVFATFLRVTSDLTDPSQYLRAIGEFSISAPTGSFSGGVDSTDPSGPWFAQSDLTDTRFFSKTLDLEAGDFLTITSRVSFFTGARGNIPDFVDAEGNLLGHFSFDQTGETILKAVSPTVGTAPVPLPAGFGLLAAALAGFAALRTRQRSPRN